MGSFAKLDFSSLFLALIAIASIVAPFVIALKFIPSVNSYFWQQQYIPSLKFVQLVVAKCLKPSFVSQASYLKQVSLVLSILLSLATCTYICKPIDKGYIAIEMMCMGRSKALTARYLAMLGFTAFTSILASVVTSIAFAIIAGVSAWFSFKLIAISLTAYCLLATSIATLAALSVKRCAEASLATIIAIVGVYIASSLTNFISVPPIAIATNIASLKSVVFLSALCFLNALIGLKVMRFEV